ncbi:MAG: glycosyltransferase family 4 protein, partial [Acidithiobacillus sp.]|nr:glycosyltransferase family 4 protein [Acidithiobacillus sp.]
MKILHWVGTSNVPQDPDRAPASGVVRVALELARAQAGTGHDVTVASISNQQWARQWDGVKLHGVPPVHWASVRFAGKELDLRQHLGLLRMASRHRFDVVHSHHYSYMRGIQAGIRIVHIHADPLYKGADNTGRAYGPKDFLRLERDSNGIIAVSAYIERQLHQGLGRTQKVFRVPNGVRVDRSSPVATSQLRERLGIPINACVFLFVGAVVAEKGVLELLQAFASLSESGEAARLLLAGGPALWDGALTGIPREYWETVQQQVKQLAGRVHLLGLVSAEEMPSIYLASDVLVVPSICPEAFSMACLEAMAYGR